MRTFESLSHISRHHEVKSVWLPRSGKEIGISDHEWQQDSRRGEDLAGPRKMRKDDHLDRERKQAALFENVYHGVERNNVDQRCSEERIDTRSSAIDDIRCYPVRFCELRITTVVCSSTASMPSRQSWQGARQTAIFGDDPSCMLTVAHLTRTGDASP